MPLKQCPITCHQFPITCPCTCCQHLDDLEEVTVEEAESLALKMGQNANSWSKMVAAVDDGNGVLDSQEIMMLMGRFVIVRLRTLV